MHPTLKSGEYLLVNKLVYFPVDTQRLSRIIPFWKVDRSADPFAARAPQRGEVIVFRFPGPGPPKDFVKRVIGLPGEEVAIRQGHVYIDGALLEEPYITNKDNSSCGPHAPGGKAVFCAGGQPAQQQRLPQLGTRPGKERVGQGLVRVLAVFGIATAGTASALWPRGRSGGSRGRNLNDADNITTLV